MKSYHLIAIGGAVMHNLALALKNRGNSVSGSDDEIYEPAKSRLQAAGILPQKIGWDASRIHQNLDGIVLGMHAKNDNPELIKAKELGLKIWSFPEFMYENSKEKLRVVIAGSHGKTTLTAMAMHILRAENRDFDYLVGSKLDGFETMVRLSDSAKLLIVEGDEYLSSPIDRRPKFLLYHPQIALISGIAWDHINVFPTLEEYEHQFALLVQALPENGTLVYCAEDERLVELVARYSNGKNLDLIPYQTPDYFIENGTFIIRKNNSRFPLKLIGKHNLLNLSGIMKVLEKLGISAEKCLEHMAGFTGAASRLERIFEDKNRVVFRDFAHSPSKLKATVEAVTELYGSDRVLAVFELHTFSSLNKAFLSQYAGALDSVKRKIVYLDSHTLAHKGMPAISADEISAAFGDDSIVFVSDSAALKASIEGLKSGKDVFLMMSSGNFGGLKLPDDLC